MNNTKCSIGLCAGAVALAFSGVAQAAESSYLGAELTYLHRSTAGGTLSYDTSTSATMGGKDAGMGYEPGVRLLFGTPVTGGYMLEGDISYYGRWKGKDSLTSIGGENIDPIRPLQSDDEDWTDAVRHSIDYKSSLWGAGLMLSKGQASGMKYGYGLGYLDLKEDFNWNTLDEPGIAPGINGNSNYRIKTKNRMFGVMGALSGGGWKLGQSATASAGLRAGLFANRASQSSRLENDMSTSPDLGLGSESKTKAAWMLEAQAKVDFPVAKGMTLSLGYRATYLNGVALAPEQVTFGSETAGPALNSRLGKLDLGNMLVHGAFLTLKGTF